MAKRVKIPGRLESAETGGIVTGADAVMDDAKGKTQVVINSEVDAAIINLAQGKQDNLTFDSAPTEDSPNPVTSAGVYTADKVLSDAIEAILLLIPSAASALNKLVDMQTMNSSIATATASFKGTYNLVSDLHLGVDATHEQIGAALDVLSLGADNNDYAFVQVPNSATAPTEIRVTERYKYNGINWLFEYDLNNSGFTQGQWNAINSGVTSLLVGKLSDLPTDAELTALLAGKQDNLTFDNVPTAGSPNPVKSGGVYARNNEIVALINALDAAKQDVLTFDNAPVEGSPNPVKSGGVYTAISAVQAAIVALDADKQNVLTFDSTPMLGSANPVTSSGIKTELNRIDGNITTLNDLYEALTQSALVIVQPTDTWPVASPATSTIYRVVDRVNTPPQNYSDYMWNGTTMVLMAEYDNAIDDKPIAGSDNLVKSGGAFNGMVGEQKFVINGFGTSIKGVNLGSFKAGDKIAVKVIEFITVEGVAPTAVALMDSDTWTSHLTPVFQIKRVDDWTGKYYLYTFENNYQNVYLNVNDGAAAVEIKRETLADVVAKVSTKLNFVKPSVVQSGVGLYNVSLSYEYWQKFGSVNFTIDNSVAYAYVLSSDQNNYASYADEILKTNHNTNLPNAYVQRVSLWAGLTGINPDDILYAKGTTLGITPIWEFIKNAELEGILVNTSVGSGINIGGFKKGESIAIKVKAYNNSVVKSVALMPVGTWTSHIEPVCQIRDVLDEWKVYTFENDYSDVYINTADGDAVVEWKRVLAPTSQLWKRKVFFIGDSLTSDSTYVNEVGKILNCDAVNYGVSGTAISGTASNSFCKRFTDLPNDAKMVVVFGGVNDFRGGVPLGNFGDANLDGSLDDTFYGALHTLMRGLRTKYQDSTIVFMTPMHFQYQERVDDGDYIRSEYQADGTLTEKTYNNGATLKQYVNAIKECADFYAINVIDLHNISGIQPIMDWNRLAYTIDGLHLSDSGSKHVARTIAWMLDKMYITD